MVSRMGYDLFTKQGRRNFESEGWEHAKYYVWGDTFKPIICRMFGHNKYETDMHELACKRCHKYLDK